MGPFSWHPAFFLTDGSDAMLTPPPHPPAPRKKEGAFRKIII